MRTSKEWGGNQEIYAASQCFHINIVIHQFEAACLVTTYEDSTGRRESKSIHLSYHGEMHYNSVTRIDDSSTGIPRPIDLHTSLPARAESEASVQKVKQAVPWSDETDIRYALNQVQSKNNVTKYVYFY